MVRWVSLAAKTPFSLPGKVDATRFTDAFSHAPASLRDQTTLSRLNALLDICREKSPFYRARLPARPLASLDELRSIPVLSQTEFREHLPPDGQGLLTGPLEGAYTFASGGTTGKPKYVYRTVEEQHRNARALAKGLYLSVFHPGDVVANLLYAGNLWASFLSFNQALEQVGCQILPIAGSIDIEFMVRYLTTFRPNGAISIPSVFLSLAQYVESHRLDLKIEKIATGGEHLFPDAREYLTRVLGTRKFASPAYATNDNGAIAFQCEMNEGAVHHVHEDLHIGEIVDPDSGDPVAEGEVGKMIVTNIDRALMPTIRYDVGDLGRFVPGRCDCGRTLRRIELLGRADDVLVIGGLKVPLDAVAAVVGRIEGLSHAFRILARRVDQLDQLVVEAEAAGVPDDARRSALEQAIVAGVRGFKPEYARFGTGGVAPILARVLDPNALPRNPRTGKIAQVVDERIGH
jgi:phenylacetate-coenzyme A ligase PaaK-like adenylate-forming protein